MDILGLVISLDPLGEGRGESCLAGATAWDLGSNVSDMCTVLEGLGDFGGNPRGEVRRAAPILAGTSGDVRSDSLRRGTSAKTHGLG